MAWSNRMFDLITPFLEEIQEIEYVLGDLRLWRSIDSAIGAQLDGLGDILNVPRAGQTDVEYRFSLKLKVYLNRSSGQPETIIVFIADITDSSVVRLMERYPGKIRLEVNGTNVIPIFPTLVQIVQQLAPAGVGVQVVYINPALSPFAFGNEGAEVTDGDGYYETGYGGAQSAGAFAELAS
jgi:hypothetical protein